MGCCMFYKWYLLYGGRREPDAYIVEVVLDEHGVLRGLYVNGQRSTFARVQALLERGRMVYEVVGWRRC